MTKKFAKKLTAGEELRGGVASANDNGLGETQPDMKKM